MARERKKSEFGKYLAQLIKDAGMTQCDFYSEAEIARPYFYDMLSGRTNPPPRETLERIHVNLRSAECDGSQGR